MGRQPWTVVGLFKTEESVSPSVSGGSVLTSLIVFTLLYGILAVVEVGLVLKLRQDRRPGRGTGPIRRGRPRGAGRHRRARGETDVRLLATNTADGLCRPSGSWLIAVLWVGYFVLEGFDFGVGVLLRIVGKDEKGRRVLINTIGPIWDGNEVWVIVGRRFIFAAFPDWYAAMFSAFYLALLLILLPDRPRGRASSTAARDTVISGGPVGTGRS